MYAGAQQLDGLGFSIGGFLRNVVSLPFTITREVLKPVVGLVSMRPVGQAVEAGQQALQQQAVDYEKEIAAIKESAAAAVKGISEQRQAFEKYALIGGAGVGLVLLVMMARR